MDDSFDELEMNTPRPRDLNPNSSDLGPHRFAGTWDFVIHGHQRRVWPEYVPEAAAPLGRRHVGHAISDFPDSSNLTPRHAPMETPERVPLPPILPKASPGFVVGLCASDPRRLGFSLVGAQFAPTLDAVEPRPPRPRQEHIPYLTWKDERKNGLIEKEIALVKLLQTERGIPKPLGLPQVNMLYRMLCRVLDRMFCRMLHCISKPFGASLGPSHSGLA